MVVHGCRILQVRTRHRSDIDIEFEWASRPSGGCFPRPEDEPPRPPVSGTLPTPGGANQPAPLPPSIPPVLAPSAPPIGGSSLIPPGYPPGSQSRPPNSFNALKLFFSAVQVVNGATCATNVTFTGDTTVPWDFSARPNPVAADFSLRRSGQSGTSCGQYFGTMAGAFQGALISGAPNLGPLGTAAQSWPVTSVQPVNLP